MQTLNEGVSENIVVEALKPDPGVVTSTMFVQFEIDNTLNIGESLN